MNPADFAVLSTGRGTGSGGAAQRLADRLGIALVDPDHGTEARYLLGFTEPDRLAIRDSAMPRMKPFAIDLARRFAAKGADPLLRAIGSGTRTVVDATAGIGVDAAHLAASGIRVTAIESHPVMHALLENALGRCEDDSIASRLDLQFADSTEWIRALPTGVDVIYLDPMYPPRPGSAAAKKGIRLLQEMVPHDPGNDEMLLAAARAKSRNRVVVKRPHHAAPVLPGKTGETRGKLVRFDIYPPL